MFDSSGRGTEVLSPAKINWTLQVVGKRPDGFHEIASLVSVVTLYDQLSFSEAAEPGITLTCSDPGVPTDENNLICRAARLMAQAAGRELRVSCRLDKRIPVGGGLGGGSGNAASTLLALNRRWGLGWPVEKLAELAARLGSDVSLFLRGGSAVMTGRGEQVRPVRLGWSGWIVLLMPGLHVSTPAVYRAWRPQAGKCPPVEPRPAEKAVEWMHATFNMLEAPAIAVCPQLGDLQRQAASLAGRPVRISGSGSTMFTAFDSPGEAEGGATLLNRELGIRAEVVQPGPAEG
jgi:4-diphosphocytidyl-2-C-methyl-D-erythritol kinase